MSGVKGKSGRKPGFKNPNAGRPEKSPSHSALLAKKICASGILPGLVSRLPAGTTTMVPSALGNADPHTEQNALVCRVCGRL